MLSLTHLLLLTVVLLLLFGPTKLPALGRTLVARPSKVVLGPELATCEFHIPRDRYDPFLLLDLIERHGATVH